MNTLTFIKKTHYIEDEDYCLWLWDASQEPPSLSNIRHTFNAGDVITLDCADEPFCWIFTSEGFTHSLSLVDISLCQQELTGDFFDQKEIFIFTLANGTPEPFQGYEEIFKKLK